MKKNYLHFILSVNLLDSKLNISFQPTNSARPEYEDDVFKINEIDLSVFDNVDSDEADRFIGGIIFNTLNNYTNGNVNVAHRNRIVDPDVREEAFKVMEKLANDGNADAQRAFAGNYLGNSIKLRDISLLDTAEHWYKQAADNGNSEAESYLKQSWPNDKEKYKELIQRLLDK